MNFIERNLDFRKTYEDKWLNKIERIVDKFNGFEKNEECYTWKDTNSIVSILNEVGEEDTHIFLPLSGGDRFKGCKLSDEKGFIELMAPDIYRVLPNKLKLYRNRSMNWDYFILETKECNRKLDFKLGENEVSEELFENKYGDYFKYYEGKYEESIEAGEDIRDLKHIIRTFKTTKYAIFHENSLYNNSNFTSNFMNIDAYEGIQNKITSKRFNDIIKKMEEVYNKILELDNMDSID